MPAILKGKHLAKSALMLAVLAMALGALNVLPFHPALADAGNNYPWKSASYPACTPDTWGFCERYCTSWVAWALHDRNKFEMGRAVGDAVYWKSWATNNHYTADHTPVVGAVAWWNGYSWNKNKGHVAWVSAVNSNGSIVVEEYNVIPGAYSNPTLVKGSGFPWPDYFIHFKDINPSPIPSTPTAVSRTSNSMDVFYNDGNNHIVNYYWGTNGWQSGYWSDNNIAGQPTVIDRTSNNLDVFYRTTDGKLEYRAWTVSNGWGNVVTMVSSGVSGDPWAIARGSNDMQIFFLYNSTQMASINWDINLGWNLTPQILYNAGATTDPVAISRNSNSMDVFFGKNNGNLVHLGWDSTNGWLTSDFSAGTGVDGRPTAIFRNGGNAMSAYYKEQHSGRVAEEFWDINNGWGWQDWNASLSGIPSVIPGISNTIDDFYRETGGNIVDRYFSSCGWCTKNIVNSGGSTGNPTAIVRGGTSIEVFYWDVSALMDANWNTGSQTWVTGKIN